MKIKNLRGWAPRSLKRRGIALIALLLAGLTSVTICAVFPASAMTAMPLFVVAVGIECIIGLTPAVVTFALAVFVLGIFMNASSSGELSIAISTSSAALSLIALIEQLQRARYGVRLVASVAQSRYEMLLRHDNARSLAQRAANEMAQSPLPKPVQPDTDVKCESLAHSAADPAAEKWRCETIHLHGDDHAVLLLHGLSSSPLELRYLARYLNGRGFTVRVPMLTGYSVGSPAGSMEQWIDIALREFDLLAQGYRHVSIGGLSMGATLALRIARERPQACSLALLSVSLDFDGWAIPWYRDLLDLMYFTPLRQHFRYRESAPYGLRNEALRAKIARAVSREALSEIGPPSLCLPAIHHAGRLMRSAAASIESVRPATLLVHAIDDETTSPHNAQRVLDRIGATTIRQVWLDDSYHIVTSDNEREIVAHETAAFLREMEWQCAASGVAQRIASKALARWNRRNVNAEANARQAA
jgi:carboxylesterase